jgi:hypothetical protein
MEIQTTNTQNHIGTLLTSANTFGVPQSLLMSIVTKHIKGNFYEVMTSENKFRKIYFDGKLDLWVLCV